MSTIKIDQDQIDGQIVNSVTGPGVNNSDPKNPVIGTAPGVATESWVNQQGFLTTEADPKGVGSIAFSGTTTKTLTITLNDGTTRTATFADLNTTYTAITAQQLTAGTDTTNQLIAAKILVDYINSRLSATMTYKGQVANYSNLPTTGNSIGDVYNVQNANATPAVKAGDNVAWNGTTWDVLAGFVDTSAFLTEETDPTGVSNIAVSGTTTKTITVTLNNGSTKTATWSDTNTTYTNGSLTTINTGTSTTGELWSAKVLNDWLNGKSFATTADITTFLGSQRNDIFIIVSGNIVSGVVNLNLTASRKSTSFVLAFYNGVKIPSTAVTINGAGNQISINQSQIATPIKVGKQVEVVYMG